MVADSNFDDEDSVAGDPEETDLFSDDDLVLDDDPESWN